jgi:hypothetical protein
MKLASLFSPSVSSARRRKLCPLELAPVEAKYRADLAALATQTAGALSQAQQIYARALGDAEKTATTAGALPAAAAIAREQAALKDALLAPDFPADLPKSLQTPRKAFLESAARVRANEAARVGARSMRIICARSPASPAALRRIPRSRNRSLRKKKSCWQQPSRAARRRPRLRGAVDENALVNGGFEQADAEGRPLGWKLPRSAGSDIQSGARGQQRGPARRDCVAR